MEGCPRSLMLSFELKESLPTEFINALKKHIRDHYQEDPENYSNECNQVEQLRTIALNATHDHSGCSQLRRYFAQLHFLQSRFPMGEGGSASVPFTWMDIYSGREVTLQDIKFEQSMVLYNLASLHTVLGAVEDRVADEGMKVACTHFQAAAGIFTYIKEHFSLDPFEDMSSEILNMNVNLLLGQAQECLLEKTILDNRKHIHVAKIGTQVADYYKQAHRVLESSAVQGMSSKKCKLWSRVLQIKMLFTRAIAHLYMANVSHDSTKFGEKVAYLKSASQKAFEAQKLAKGQPDRTLEMIQFLIDVVSNQLEGAVKDNDFIYHEAVPELDALPEIKGAPLVKPIPFQACDPIVSGGDIFQRLIPMEAHALASLYSEEKAKLLRKQMALMEEKNTKLSKAMASLHIDDLLRPDETDALPADLLEKIEEWKKDPDALKSVTGLFEDILKLSESSAEKLNTIKSTVAEEMGKEKDLEEKYGRKYNFQADVADLVKLDSEMGKLQEEHAKALLTNSELKKHFDVNKKNLELLAGPLEALQNTLPSQNALDAPVDDEAVQRLRDLIAKVEKMKSQRKQLEDELRNQLNKDDVTARLVTRGEGSQDAFFQEELKKHDGTCDLIHRNLDAQDKIIQALTEANAKYAKTREKVMEVTARRDAMIKSLIASNKSFHQLKDRLRRGLQYYTALSKQLKKMQTSLAETCSYNAKERKKIEDRAKKDDDALKAKQPLRMPVSGDITPPMVPPSIGPRVPGPFPVRSPLATPPPGTQAGIVHPFPHGPQSPDIRPMLTDVNAAYPGVRHPFARMPPPGQADMIGQSGLPASHAGIRPQQPVVLPQQGFVSPQPLSNSYPITSVSQHPPVTSVSGIHSNLRPQVQAHEPPRFPPHQIPGVRPQPGAHFYSRPPTPGGYQPGQTPPRAPPAPQSPGQRLPYRNAPSPFQGPPGGPLPRPLQGMPPSQPPYGMVPQPQGYGAPRPGPPGHIPASLPPPLQPTVSHSKQAPPTYNQAFVLPAMSKPVVEPWNQSPTDTPQGLPPPLIPQQINPRTPQPYQPEVQTGKDLPSRQALESDMKNQNKPVTQRLSSTDEPFSPKTAAPNWAVQSQGPNPAAGHPHGPPVHQQPLPAQGSPLIPTNPNQPHPRPPLQQQQLPQQQPRPPQQQPQMPQQQPQLPQQPPQLLQQQQQLPQQQPRLPQQQQQPLQHIHQQQQQQVPHQQQQSQIKAPVHGQGPIQPWQQPQPKPVHAPAGPLPQIPPQGQVFLNKPQYHGPEGKPQQLPPSSNRPKGQELQPKKDQQYQPQTFSQPPQIQPHSVPPPNSAMPAQRQAGAAYPQASPQGEKRVLVGDQPWMTRQQKHVESPPPQARVSSSGVLTYSQQSPIPSATVQAHKVEENQNQEQLKSLQSQMQQFQQQIMFQQQLLIQQQQQLLEQQTQQKHQEAEHTKIVELTQQMALQQNKLTELQKQLQEKESQHSESHKFIEMMELQQRQLLQQQLWHQQQEQLRLSQQQQPPPLQPPQLQQQVQQPQLQQPPLQQLQQQPQLQPQLQQPQQQPQLQSQLQQPLLQQQQPPLLQQQPHQQPQQQQPQLQQPQQKSQPQQQQPPQQVQQQPQSQQQQQLQPQQQQIQPQQQRQPQTHLTTTMKNVQEHGGEAVVSEDAKSPSTDPSYDVNKPIPDPPEQQLTSDHDQVPQPSPDTEDRSDHQPKNDQEQNQDQHNSTAKQEEVPEADSTPAVPNSEQDEDEEESAEDLNRLLSEFTAEQPTEDAASDENTDAESNPAQAAIDPSSYPVTGCTSAQDTVHNQDVIARPQYQRQYAHTYPRQPSFQLQIAGDVFISEAERLTKLQTIVQGFEAVLVSLMAKDGLQREWQMLSKMQTMDAMKMKLTTNAGEGHPHQNRYTDILPWDQSRVKLLTKEGDDYINASRIEGISPASLPYIACQGPTPTTFSDFWLMVWEQQTPVIIMLTKEVEKNKLKCHQYWPVDEGHSMLFNEIKITLKRQTVQPLWIERIIHVFHEEDDEYLLVTHLQFTTWPDHGVPSGASDILSLVSEVQTIYTANCGDNTHYPILMHCSAGVGRTGAFAVIFSAIRDLHIHNEIVDIPKVVRCMRQQRQHMIQKMDQYEFVYKAILFYAHQYLSLEKAKHRFSTSDPIPSTGPEADEKGLGKSNYCAEGCESSKTPKPSEDSVFPDTPCHNDNGKETVDSKHDNETTRKDSLCQDDELRSRVMDEQKHNQLSSATVEQENKTDTDPETVNETGSDVLPTGMSTSTVTSCSGEEASAESASERTGTDTAVEHPSKQQGAEETLKTEEHDGVQDSSTPDCNHEK